MISRYAAFSSTTAPGVLAGRESASDFTIRFDPPLTLAGKNADVKGSDELQQEWSVALVSWSGFNTVPNVSAVLYNNARFTYSGGGPAINVDIPTGIYSIAQINTLIAASLLANTYLATDIVFAPNTSTGKIVITLAAGFSWDLTTSNFYQLMGFELSQSPVTGAASVTGNLPGNLNNGITAFYLRSDVVLDSAVNGRQSDVLAIYQPNVPIGKNITLDIKNPIYLRCKTNQQISSIRLYVTDDQGRAIDYNGNATTNGTVWGLDFKRIAKRLY